MLDESNIVAVSYVVDVEKENKDCVPDLVEGMPAVDVSFSLFVDDKEEGGSPLSRLDNFRPQLIKCESSARATEPNKDQKIGTVEVITDNETSKQRKELKEITSRYKWLRTGFGVFACLTIIVIGLIVSKAEFGKHNTAVVVQDTSFNMIDERDKAKYLQELLSMRAQLYNL